MLCKSCPHCGGDNTQPEISKHWNHQPADEEILYSRKHIIFCYSFDEYTNNSSLYTMHTQQDITLSVVVVVGYVTSGLTQAVYTSKWRGAPSSCVSNNGRPCKDFNWWKLSAVATVSYTIMTWPMS